MRRTALALVAIACLLPAAQQAWSADPSDGGWVNATSDVGGPTWAPYGMHLLTGMPGKDADTVIAGISGCGLWASTDRGASWKHLGDAGTEQIRSRPSQVLFDPQHPEVFWVTAIYGAGLFKTSDGGRSFAAVGNLQHIDSLAVDVADPERRLMLICRHEQARSLEKSSDGGRTWEPIGKNLPEDTNHTTHAIIIDARTYLVNCAGWAQGRKLGIYRTEDGGTTWTKVSDLGPAGPPLVASDGAIYWQRLWGGGLLRSADQGRTWAQLAGPVKSHVIEAPAGSGLGGATGALIGCSDSGAFASVDGGKTWTTLSARLPVKPTGLAYDPRHNSLFISQMKEKQSGDAVWRLDLK
jgi:photosystem II stability/assembly factor-like uncharacterized protein